MFPTIKDIAKKAGFSYATVSRSLNGKYGVNPETKAKILKIAADMGYKPNAIAQSLVTNSTQTIGLIIQDITSPFFPRVALGVEDTMAEAGFSVFLCNSNWSVERERAHLDKLSQRQVDGIILCTTARHADEIEPYVNYGIPLVYISSYPKKTNKSYACLDNIYGADMAVSHLISQGRRRIAFLGSVQEQHSLDDRLAGYKKALRRASLKIDKDLIHLGEFKEESGYDMTRALFAKGIVPDGVFAENDLIAMGAIQSIGDAGYSVPRDISVVGFDNIPMASHRDIQLSTIHQPKYRIGQCAAEIMLHHLSRQDDSDSIQRKTFQPELIIRKSS